MFHRFHPFIVIWIPVFFFSSYCLCLDSHAGRLKVRSDVSLNIPGASPFSEHDALVGTSGDSQPGYTGIDDFSLDHPSWGGMRAIGSVLQDTAAQEDVSDYIAQLKSAEPYNRLRLTLGRQRILAGVTDQHVDGLKLSTGLGPFSATAFGGRPSFLPDADNNLIYGARLASHPMSLFEIGLSYQKLEDRIHAPEENAGADFRFKLGSHLTLSGLSTYNVDGRGWREHSYAARMDVKNLQIKPYYRYFQLDEHFEKSSMENYLFGFLTDNEEVVNIGGTDILWRGFGPLQVGLRGRRYDYAHRDEKANYYSGLLNVRGSGGSRIDFEAGRMAGETPENRYSLFHCNVYWQTPFDLERSFFSADALYLDYDQSIRGREGALHASLSGGFFLQNTLEVRFSGIYSRDPYYPEDVGAMISVLFRL